MSRDHYPLPLLIGVLIVAALTRGILVQWGNVSFQSDEAIVALMARHITQGQHMTFYYGQAYMGSLNAYPTAAGFALFGEHIDTLRWIQWGKNLLMVGSTFALAWAITQNRIASTSAALFMAIPPTVGALYTTINIGSYVETLIFGQLMFLFTYRIVHDGSAHWIDWGALGFFAGLAWWGNVLIVVYGIPVALAIGWHLLRRPRHTPNWTRFALTLALFLVGSAPFWWHALTYDFEAVRVYFPSDAQDNATIDIDFMTKLLGLLLFAFPSVTGLRHPWATDYFMPLWGLPIIILHVVAAYVVLRSEAVTRFAKLLLFGVIVSMVALFVGTSFRPDPTGRYFLPVLTPLALALGLWTAKLASVPRLRYGWWIPLALVLAYHGAGQYDAASTDFPSMTPQLLEDYNQLNDENDAALIDFLTANDLQHGYTNYWVAFRLAFVTHETLQYSASLPYKRDLSYTPADNRYLPYVQATETADKIAYINMTYMPELDAVLRERFDALGITYRVETIGQFIVYYDFAPTVPRLTFGTTHD